MERNEAFLARAESLKPELNKKIRTVRGSGKAMKKGDALCFDFGEHLVGKVSLKLSFSGSHPDAPAWLRLKFAERLQELRENVENYRGWISASWVQQEQLHVDAGKCMVIEDSYNGIIAADRAGMVPVMVPDMLPPDEEMRKRAAYILPSLSDVMELLDQKAD